MFFFFFKQKTAYEMRISDWSSDVCSSDLLLPDAIAEPMMKKAGIDRLAALHTALDAVRRGGTVSLSGVYGGAVDPMPMFQMFDKQIQLRMGQAKVSAYTDTLLAMLVEYDPFGRQTERRVGKEGVST